MKSFLQKLTFLLAVTTSLYSYAWGLLGHRIIAEIADHHLSKKSRKAINSILDHQKMAYWANYPDFVKSDTTGVYKPMSAWHYVNIDPHSDFSGFLQDLQAQKAPNLYTQIKVLTEKLKDKNLGQEDKKIGLIYLVHLMGDLAQPMHTGRAGDLGGNKIKVMYFGTETNLHSLWDEKMLDRQQYSYTEYANLLDRKTKQEVATIESGTLEDWLYDSHLIANKIYAQTPAGANLRYDYDYKFTYTMERQLLYGGLRLAKVLNDIFG